MMPRTFTIQEASQRSDLTKHTLRYWEKELEGILSPLRSKGGQRRYTEEHLFLIEEIKRLKVKGLRLADIKLRLAKGKSADVDGLHSEKVEQLANRIAEIVRVAIHSFLEKEALS
jgi:DNA-binding transcriptional MerR regulator